MCLLFFLSDFRSNWFIVGFFFFFEKTNIIVGVELICYWVSCKGFKISVKGGQTKNLKKKKKPKVKGFFESLIPELYVVTVPAEPIGHLGHRLRPPLVRGPPIVLIYYIML